MSLCDRCYAPGMCCKNIEFYNSNGRKAYFLDTPIIDQISNGFPPNYDIPFKVDKILERWTAELTGQEYAYVSFSCKNLQPDGRCGDYENRPDLCRIYHPGQDKNCTHFCGETEGGSDIELPLHPVILGKLDHHAEGTADDVAVPLYEDVWI